MSITAQTEKVKTCIYLPRVPSDSSRLHQLKQVGRIRQVRQQCCTCVTFFGRYMYEYTILFKVTDLVQIFDLSTH